MVVLAIWNVAANVLVPGAAAVPVNVVAAALLLGLAFRSGADATALGLRKRSVANGVRVGAAAIGVAVLAVAVASAVPVSRALLADGRFVGVAMSGVLYETAGRIPIGTVLAEEIAFRGALLGMLLRWTSPLRATVVSSVLFGLWHVLPAIAALESATAVGLPAGLHVTAVAVGGQVMVTALAGVVFAWLRFRGDSLAAPALAHWGLNGAAYVAGWLIVRNAWA